MSRHLPENLGAGGPHPPDEQNRRETFPNRLTEIIILPSSFNVRRIYLTAERINLIASVSCGECLGSKDVVRDSHSAPCDVHITEQILITTHHCQLIRQHQTFSIINLPRRTFRLESAELHDLRKMAGPHPHEAQFLYYLPNPNETIAVNDWDCVLGLDPSRYKEVTLPLFDCREHEEDFTFDRDGFCFRTLNVEEDIIVNEASYVRQVEEMLKTELYVLSKFMKGTG